MKHFETLWEEAEKIATQLEPNISSGDILENLTNLIFDFDKLTKDKESDFIIALKKKKMGEIMFLLTHLAFKENINVYAELQTEVNYNQIELIDDKNIKKSETDPAHSPQ